MQGISLAIMTDASLGLDNLSSETSCSGPRNLRNRMYSG